MTTQEKAMNIVNQLADLWRVDTITRQETNDQADKFVSALIDSAKQEARGCIDCQKLRCEDCERLWQT